MITYLDKNLDRLKRKRENRRWRNKTEMFGAKGILQRKAYREVFEQGQNDQSRIVS